MEMPDVINLGEKFSQFDEHWSPRTVAGFNGHDVMVVKVLGEFVWHHHDHEDELFLVVKGTLHMEYRDKTVVLNEGEFCIVPHGVEAIELVYSTVRQRGSGEINAVVRFVVRVLPGRIAGARVTGFVSACDHVVELEQVFDVAGHLGRIPKKNDASHKNSQYHNGGKIKIHLFFSYI